MKFVVGIGNPEANYEKTRHNIGFAVVDRLQKAEARADVLLVKPWTYVNRTGDAVVSLLKKYPQAAEKDFLFVCDDVNLEFGKLRLRGSGSAGGHHGLESVIAAFGSEDFPRLRVGVGREAMPKDLEEFVLEKFSKDEEKTLGGVLEKAALVCESWVKEGLEAAMNVLSRLQTKNN